jgi:hypothetical protein
MDIVSEYARAGRRLQSFSSEILDAMFKAAARIYAETPTAPAAAEMSLEIYSEYVLRRRAPPVHLIQEELAQIRHFDMGAPAEPPLPIAANLKN